MRSKFFGVFAAVVFVISLFALGAEAADTYRIKLGQTVSEQDLNFIAVRDVFKTYVESTSEGRLVVDLYPNNTLGGERQMVEGLILGTIEMGVLSPAVVAGFVPSWQVFDLPYLFKDRETAYKALDGALGDRLRDDSLKKGIRCFVFPENGVRQVTNNRGPINTPEDFNGMKIRVMENPVHMATFKAFGANPTPISFGELYTALHQKTVDGQDNPATVVYSSKFYEVQKYLSLTGHVYAPSSMLISEEFYKKLPEDLQKILRDGAEKYRDAERESCSSNEGRLIEEMVKSGVEVNEVSPENKKVFMELTKPIYDEFKDKIGADVIELAASFN